MVFSKFKANIVDEHNGSGLISKRTRVVSARGGASRTASPEAPRYLDHHAAPPAAVRTQSQQLYSQPHHHHPPGSWIDPRASAQRSTPPRASAQRSTPPSSSAASSVFSNPAPARRPSVTYRHSAPSVKVASSESSSPVSEHSAEAIFDSAPPRKSLLKRLNSQKQRKPKAPRTAMEWAGLPPRETLPPRVVSSMGDDDDDLPLCGPWTGR
ncbi:hypothetical protein DIURU_002295 [Diutina rugosa]|uniref:Uncharacterized protein n=1 Tax=Diutina rugosa TaxID=5481 RepID=A0A642URD9_DIURU|nr:uncharacterized protein DIURU_002295 [Diutina rugosa]KAA8903783.1 hypothetical protein DIURU_002295 [Diutina rugosa]